jgi:RNA polymerase sigma-70 factor, ECF subfamily
MDAGPQWLDADGASDHLDRLYGAARALCRDREQAEDLVQETYARVLARPRFLRRGDTLSYLLGALHKTFLHQLRADARQLRGDGVNAEFDPIDRSGHMRPDVTAESREVLATIATLPLHLRLTLVAVDVLGLSHEEAARALRVPAGTVRSRTSRARERVAARLSPDSEAKAPPRSLDTWIMLRPTPRG